MNAYTPKSKISAKFTNLDGERRMVASVMALIQTHDDDEIAEATGLPLSFVRLTTREHRAKSGKWLRDNKTGRIFWARSNKALYRMVCIRGLVDWDFGRVVDGRMVADHG